MQGTSTTAILFAAHGAVRSTYVCHLQKCMPSLPLHILMTTRIAAETPDNNLPQKVNARAELFCFTDCTQH